MLKIIAICVATLLTLLSSCGTPDSPTASTAESAADQMEVMVLFGGLMVFNLNPRTGSYEVGILSEENSKGHDFCVQTLGAPRICRETPQQRNSEQEGPQVEGEWLPEGTRWTLSVTNPPNDTPVTTTQSLKRRPDVEGSQFDFQWIIDLDGPEFHNRKLELRQGQLQPIIQLPPVKLFTKYKSPDFVRLNGEQSKEVFGFVAEVIGFRVQLKKGEELTLKDQDTGTVITTVPYVPPSPIGGNSQVVYITNARFPQTPGSDFKMYYNIFEKVNKSEQYDFEENTTEPCEPPHQTEPCLSLNPTPRKPQDKVLQDNLRTEKMHGYITCCGLVCTQIRLVNWNQSLH